MSKLPHQWDFYTDRFMLSLLRCILVCSYNILKITQRNWLAVGILLNIPQFIEHITVIVVIKQLKYL